jgi:hypothetical protein
MKAICVNENMKFERGQDPKKSMKIGMSSKSPKEIAEDMMSEVFMEYAQLGNWPGYAGWLMENLKEQFLSATYGDYPMDSAQMDFDDFLEAFNSSNTNLEE